MSRSWKKIIVITGLVGTAAAGGALYYLSSQMSLSHRPMPTVLDNPVIRRPLTREASFQSLASSPDFDVVVIGGGATGCGVAFDAVTRGLKVAMFEREDYAAGTSSRSTKLAHGGLRYLEKAFMNLDYEQLRLVDEALNERGIMLRVAPHLVQPIAISVLVEQWWKIPKLWIGVKLYDWLSGAAAVGDSSFVSREETLRRAPCLDRDKIVGSIEMWEGQINDSRLAVSVALSAAAAGAVTLNHCEVVRLVKDGAGKVAGVVVKDVFTGKTYTVKARMVINATGPFSDAILKLDNPEESVRVTPSVGAHVVVRKSALDGLNTCLLVPETSDKRIMFANTWEEDSVIIGTTDHPAATTCAHPMASEADVEWIIGTLNKYTVKPLTTADVRSVFCGIRPLATDPHKVAKKTTSQISRDHIVSISPSNLVTINGGKWTTYRLMAQDTVNKALLAVAGRSPQELPCVTDKQSLWGAAGYRDRSVAEWKSAIAAKGVTDDATQTRLLSYYGDRVLDVLTNRSTKRLHPDHTYLEADVEWAVQNEYACTVPDVLARRLRLAFIDREHCLELVPRVAEIMARSLKWDTSRKNAEIAAGRKYLAAFSATVGDACAGSS